MAVIANIHNNWSTYSFVTSDDNTQNVFFAEEFTRQQQQSDAEAFAKFEHNTTVGSQIAHS